MHQFNKLEMFVYCHPEDAAAEHERLPETTDAGGKAKKGGTRAVATLNGTLATTRWLVALLETHQQADGSVTGPEILRPYLRGQDVLRPVA